MAFHEKIVTLRKAAASPGLLRSSKRVRTMRRVRTESENSTAGSIGSGGDLSPTATPPPSTIEPSPLVLASVGDRWSGKSSLYVRHVTKLFPEHHVKPAEVEDCEPVFFSFQSAEGGGDGRKVVLDLFEVSGDMYDFNEIRHFNYKRSDIVLLVFSVVRPASFENVLTRWAPEVRRYARKGTPMLLVGTQTDMRLNQNIVDSLVDRCEAPITHEQGRLAAKKLKAVKYIECSAKTGAGVTELFDEVKRLAQWLDKRAQREMCVIS